MIGFVVLTEVLRGMQTETRSESEIEKGFAEVIAKGGETEVGEGVVKRMEKMPDVQHRSTLPEPLPEPWPEISPEIWPAEIWPGLWPAERWPAELWPELWPQLWPEPWPPYEPVCPLVAWLLLPAFRQPVACALPSLSGELAYC